MAVPTVNGEDYRFQWGKGVVFREGTDVLLVGTGLMVDVCLRAAEGLQQEGISAGVLNIHTIKPIDGETIIRMAKATGAVVTAEEHSIIGGLGSAVAEVLCESYPVPMKRVGINDAFGESGKPMELLSKFGLDPQSVMAAAKDVIRRKKQL